MLKVDPKLLRKQIAALEKANAKGTDDLLMGVENMLSEVLDSLKRTGRCTLQITQTKLTEE